MGNQSQKIHFIAVGGSIMHNLAICLKEQGFIVTGSDDQFFEPSKSRLQKHGILPAQEGWFEDKITTDLDAIILGMHAKSDNPELLKAEKLGLKIYSFPEYLYEQSKNKQRIVIAGSHGKTTITSMILHVLKYHKRKFDYAVGAQIEGFENMVHIANDSPYIIIEGDEYLTSPLDRVPKFTKYHHHIALISGIAWDHANVFPVESEYIQLFEKLSLMTPKAGTLIYNDEDKNVRKIGESNPTDIVKIAYKTPKYKVKEGVVYCQVGKQEVPLQIFGKHNLSNLEAARQICDRLCVSETEFAEAIQSFKGAGKRLEVIAKTVSSVVYRDFAHAPSKLYATVDAVKELFPKRHLIACLELHTFSSLNKAFLPQYKGKFDAADTAIVFYNPDTLERKGLPTISEEELKGFFNRKNILVFTNGTKLQEYLLNQDLQNKNVLLMSSGNFENIDFQTFGNKILKIQS